MNEKKYKASWWLNCYRFQSKDAYINLKATNNISKEGKNGDILVSSIIDALMLFNWKNSPEGFDYWTSIYEIERERNKTIPEPPSNKSEGTFTPPFNTHYVKGPLDESSVDDINWKENILPFIIDRQDTTKAYTAETTKKIIGYKAPIDLFRGRIKKGSIFSKYSPKKLVMYSGIFTTSGIATEIVKTWEPVYAPDDVTLNLGRPSTRIVISSDGTIEARGRYVDFNRINKLKNSMNGGHQLNDWPIHIPEIVIGCSRFTKAEINTIWDTFVNLNKEYPI